MRSAENVDFSFSGPIGCENEDPPKKQRAKGDVQSKPDCKTTSCVAIQVGGVGRAAAFFKGQLAQAKTKLATHPDLGAMVQKAGDHRRGGTQGARPGDGRAVFRRLAPIEQKISRRGKRMRLQSFLPSHPLGANWGLHLLLGTVTLVDGRFLFAFVSPHHPPKKELTWNRAKASPAFCRFTSARCWIKSSTAASDLQ